MPVAIGSRRSVLFSAKDPNILLEENWDGGMIDPGRWTVVDTENKLSVSGGNLVCAGGKAAPADGDPAVWGKALIRVAGLTLQAQITPGATNKTSYVGFDNNQAGGFGNADWVAFSGGTNTLRAGDNGSAKVITAFTATPYLVRIVLQSQGAIWYISQDNGATWKCIWISSTSTVATLYPALMSYNDTITSSYIRVYQGSVRPAVISTTPTAPTPTLGGELVTNGTMELDANWDSKNAPTTNERSNTQAHGGTYSRHVVADAAGVTEQGITQTETTVVGTWYQTSGWLWLVSGTYSYIAAGAGVSSAVTTTGSWQQRFLGFRATSITHALIGMQKKDAEAYYDDITAKPLTLSSCLSLAGTVASRDGIYDSAPTLTAATQCGMAILVDDVTNPTDGLFAYHDGTNANLVRLENGTWTSSIAAAAAYGAERQLRVVIVGSSVALYYNGTQIGTTQTIDLSGYGYQCSGFSTLAANTLGAMAVNQGF